MYYCCCSGSADLFRTKTLHLPPRGIMPSRMGMPLPPPLIPPIMGRRRAIDTLILWPWNSLPVGNRKYRSMGAFDSSIEGYQWVAKRYISCWKLSERQNWIFFGMSHHTIKMFHSCFGTDGLFIRQGGNSFGLSRLIVLVYVNGRLAKSAVHLCQ